MGKSTLAVLAVAAATFVLASCDSVFGGKDDDDDDPGMEVSLSVGLADAQGNLGGTDPTPSALGRTVYLGLSTADNEDVKIARKKFTYADSAAVNLVDLVESSSNYNDTFVFTEAGTYTLSIMVDIDGNREAANDAGINPYGDYAKKVTVTVNEGDTAKNLSFTLGTEVPRVAVPWTDTSWYAANADLGNGQTANIRLVQPTNDTFEFWIVDDVNDTEPNYRSTKGVITNIADSGLSAGGLTRFRYDTDTTHVYYNGWHDDDGTTIGSDNVLIEQDPSDYIYIREAGADYMVFRLDQGRDGYAPDGSNGDTTITFDKVASF